MGHGVGGTELNVLPAFRHWRTCINALELQLSLFNYLTRDSLFNPPPVILDVRWTFDNFSKYQGLNVAPAQLCALRSDYAFK